MSRVETHSGVASSSVATQSTLSPHSCLSCRQLHRKCSKTLPSCQYCIKRGYKCIYEPSSSGRRKAPNSNQSASAIDEIVFINDEYSQKIISSKQGNSTVIHHRGYHPYQQPHLTSNKQRNSNNHVNKTPATNHDGTSCTESITAVISSNEMLLQHQMNYRFSATQALDVYYHITALGYPVYDRSKLEKALDFQLNEQLWFQTQPYQVSCELEKEVAVLQTMQAVCLQQMGILREVSDQLFMNGKRIIGKYFDEVDSISVLVAMNFMADYMLGNGEKTKSRAMYMTVRAKLEPYIKECYRLFADTLASANIHEHGSPTKLPNITVQYFSAFLLDSQTKFHEFYFIEELHPETFIFDEFEMASMFRLKRSKLNETSCRCLSNEMYHQLMTIHEIFVSMADLIMTVARKKHSLMFLFASMIAKQVHLEILTNCEKKNVKAILRVSREVIELTKHELFNFLPCCATKAVIMACSLRVEYFSQLSSCDNMNDDLRALKLLSNKYRLIQQENSQLIKAIEALTYLPQQATHSEMVASSFLSLNNDVSHIEMIHQHSHSIFSHGNSYTESFEDEVPIYNTTISPENTALDMEKVLNNFRANKDTLSQYLIGVEMLELLFEGLVEEQRIKNSGPLSLELLNEARNTKLDFITKLIENAKQRNDVCGLIETEMLRKQATAEYYFEKMKLEKPYQNFDNMDATDISMVFRFEELSVDE
ncbi:hypothetical protein C9374_001094 [Naegleria lovaniensis]|uniref:Zn(2)-C6 fungal-type domain-containing protein n=1 Tax=Naegleria lovaniensis TaxID=51637 RepID=A0AA88GRF7_NAELO|nr:uncharacterized protein C9374_001094 [Naegleria lovaniensis]KAG2387500.1 hypothetical protein C9374_001094 [Naegleria lovaniensis]